MATLFARLIPRSVSPTFARARHASTPAQCLCRDRRRDPQAPADQDHFKRVSARRAAEERVSTRCAVLTFARSVWTTLTGTGPHLGQRLKASLADQVRYDLDRWSRRRAWGVRTLVLVAFLLAASPFDAVAVELVNPHDVLNQTKRDMIELDKRTERDKAERQKEEKEREARQKQEEAERQKREKAEKALQGAQRKREAAEQQKRATEEKALQEAQRKREGAEQQKRAAEEKALQEAQRKREGAEQQAREEAARQEAQRKREAAEQKSRATKEKALQEAQRRREAAATEAAKGAAPSSPTTTPSRPSADRPGSKFEEDPTVTASVHSAAPHHLPAFFTAPGETDGLMVGVAVFLVLAVITVGILFLRLHTLPERIAHKSHKLQFEIVAVLGLLALFTHVHLFWVAGLLLAMIDLPDFGWPLGRIAGAAEKMAGMKPGEGAAQVPNGTVIGTTPAEAPVEAPAQTRVQDREKELAHA